jgi:hypothetical protein
MVTYSQIKNCNVVKRSDGASIPFDPANTDYMAFKLALQTSKNADGTSVELQDENGTAMTSAQITTFLETLP